MSGTPLSRLRTAFVALAVVLLCAVGVLLWSVLSRLEQQRLLRHRMVAERVFDEVERELGSLLSHESRRPGAAYDGVATDVTRWSPFVVGYYRREPELAVIAADQLAADRRARLLAAVAGVATAMDRASPVALDAPEDAEPLARPARPSSPDVLRQLNRGLKVRRRLQLERVGGFAVVAADARTLVAERRSPEHDRREGYVLDVPRLVATIQEWVLGAQGLDEVAALSLSESDASPEAAGTGADGAYRFTHRLAPPLESQQLSLRLSRLDDADAASALFGLAGLLATAVVLGLFALYRMVAVQVRFAERRNNFVSAVSHELKTPLTAIRMYGEMLRDGMVEDAAARQDYYGIITAESERLTRLIDNVLEHARLRRGERPMHVIRADVGAVVREVAGVLAPHIRQRGFELELEVPVDLPPVRLDVDAFKQVLFNVLDNALKYGGDGGTGTLRVRCTRERDGVTVSVRDFGPGITSGQLATIFEPFYRGQDELTRRQQGTGIGLSLVRDLVHRMHGQVTGVNRDPGLEVRIALSA